MLQNKPVSQSYALAKQFISPFCTNGSPHNKFLAINVFVLEVKKKTYWIASPRRNNISYHEISYLYK